MSKNSSARQRRFAAAQKRRQQRQILVGVLAVAGLLAVAVLAIFALGGDDEPRVADAPQQPAQPAAWTAEPYAGGPRLAVDKTVVDHGAVDYGHEVEATFALRNVGDEPVTIGKPEVEILEGC